ncbi:MAG TPA: hypothetical protein PLG05_09105 [Bacteroidales bacterium]|nr:hypothetical protein [Bacteroidales bacterium]HOR60834.1 hypothetical protein [Bacteroidales bacterium]HPL05320.1 hypothetical protein [Bacteroidales bacterium]HPX75915.1 hypothetical protein [Bacteroidales bacterium]HQB21190.1 hypothetical protein [Bacteroidales bacterium]
MKKIVFIILVALCFGGISCVKQNNCNCDITGKYIYYEEPQEIYHCGYQTTVHACFISQNNFNHYIVGSIPKDFRVKDTINVSVCLEVEIHDACTGYGVGGVYKLRCIEKVE